MRKHKPPPNVVVKVLNPGWIILISRVSALFLGIVGFAAVGFGAGEEDLFYYLLILCCFYYACVPRFLPGMSGIFLLHSSSGISILALYIYWLCTMPSEFTLLQIDSWLAIAVSVGTFTSIAMRKRVIADASRLRW